MSQPQIIETLLPVIVLLSYNPNHKYTMIVIIEKSLFTLEE